MDVRFTLTKLGLLEHRFESGRGRIPWWRH